MTISAKCLLKSRAKNSGIMIATMELLFPRFILPEFNTYRMFSRNASSSRAIPITRFLLEIERNPAMPVYWGLNQSGMSAAGQLSELGEAQAKIVWLRGRDRAVSTVREMLSLEEIPHKQIVNRLVEPWAHIRVVVTSTQWANFFAQRIHADAQPEIHALAEAMLEALRAAPEQALEPGQWHLPYISTLETENYLMGTDALDRALTVSTARCARVSYNNFDGRKTTFEEDLVLAEKLLNTAPLHASPAEHQATPDQFKNVYDANTKSLTRVWDNPKMHGNLIGFNQYRKTLATENISVYEELSDPPMFY